MNQSGTYTVAGVDDVEDFKLTLHCMKNIGFTDQEVSEVCDAVVGILNLGNVTFSNEFKGNGDQAVVDEDSQQFLEIASRCFKLTREDLLKAMTQNVKLIGKDKITNFYNADEAGNTRDALAKIIYSKMFNWIVKKVNASISKKMNSN